MVRKNSNNFLQNDFHPNLIMFTYEQRGKQLNFLNVILKIEGDKLSTYLFCKSMECHQYPDYSFCCLDHIKKSSVYSQGLHLERLCSDKRGSDFHLKNLKE